MQFFLKESKFFHASLTNTFHLMNSLRVASDLLSTEVERVVGAGASDEVLRALYSPPMGASGQNIRQFAAAGAVAREHALAELWLFDLMGRYEFWSKSLPALDGVRGAQFPTKDYSPHSAKSGYGDIFGQLAVDPRMSAAFLPGIEADPNFLGERVDDALLIFRLYKECRNSLSHTGGLALPLAEVFGAEASSRAADLHVLPDGQHVPMPVFLEDEPVRISFQQIRCFSAILLRLVFTLDSHMLRSPWGHAEWTRRWEANFGIRQLVTTKKKFPRWVSDYFARIGTPAPLVTDELRDLLSVDGKVQIRP